MHNPPPTMWGLSAGDACQRLAQGPEASIPACGEAFPGEGAMRLHIGCVCGPSRRGVGGIAFAPSRLAWAFIAPPAAMRPRVCGGPAFAAALVELACKGHDRFGPGGVGHCECLTTADCNLLFLRIQCETFLLANSATHKGYSLRHRTSMWGHMGGLSGRSRPGAQRMRPGRSDDSSAVGLVR